MEKKKITKKELREIERQEKLASGNYYLNESGRLCAKTTKKKGQKHSLLTRQRQSLALTKLWRENDEYRRHMSAKMSDIAKSHTINGTHYQVTMIDTKTGKKYKSLKDCVEDVGKSYKYIKNHSERFVKLAFTKKEKENNPGITYESIK